MLLKVIHDFYAALPAEADGCCVALSGGVDSTVLLHALAVSGESGGRVLRAAHVDHGLHPDAGRWAQHCRSLCDRLGVPLTVLQANVRRSSEHGLEAAARRVRYAALARELRRGECLLTAHHQEDQLETVLLRLLRGSGVEGIAGVPPCAPFARGWLMRPLLDLPKPAILEYARQHALEWIEDPSNIDVNHDRNYLRHRVVPLLRERWPAVAATTARTARLARDASRLLEEFAIADQAAVRAGDAIDLAALHRLSVIRQRNLLRHVLRQRGLDMPSSAQLDQGIAQLLHARPDRQPVMRWPGGQIRRYRGRLYFLDFDPDKAAMSLPAEHDWSDIDRPLTLGGCRGQLRIEPCDGAGLCLAENRLRVRFRAGGEKIRGAGRAHHQSVKKLFQHWGVLPWMRHHVPLIYAAGRLVGVADLMVSADAISEGQQQGHRIVWEDHAPCRETANGN